MINSSRIEVANRNYDSYRQYEIDKRPRRQEFKKPAKPIRHGHLQTDHRAAELQIDQPLFRYYLEVAFSSDNPLVVHKLKELLMCVKLTLDGEDTMLDAINKDLAEYYRQLREYEDQVAEEEKRFTREHKMYSLHCLKKEQDLRFYLEDMVEASITRFEENRGTVWDKFLCEILAEECQTELEYTYWEEAFNVFKKFSLSTKMSVIEEIENAHKRWIETQLDDSTEEIYENSDVHGCLVELEGEEFTTLFDEEGEVIEDAMDLYYRRVDEIESEFRYEARLEAVRLLQERHYNEEDGYDTIYHYGPNG